HLTTAVLDTDFLEQRANAGAGTESLAREHILARNHRFSIVALIDDHAITGDFLHCTASALSSAISIGNDHLCPFSFAHFLHYYLLGYLLGDTAELFGLDLFLDHISDLQGRVALLGLIQGQLHAGLFEVLVRDHGPAAVGIMVAGLPI